MEETWIHLFSSLTNSSLSMNVWQIFKQEKNKKWRDNFFSLFHETKIGFNFLCFFALEEPSIQKCTNEGNNFGTHGKNVQKQLWNRRCLLTALVRKSKHLCMANLTLISSCDFVSLTFACTVHINGFGGTQCWTCNFAADFKKCSMQLVVECQKIESVLHAFS